MMLLKSYKRMQAELENTIRQHVYARPFRKHDIIQAPGTVSNQLYFVEKGLLQFYHQVKDKKSSLRFKKEDDFIIALSSILRIPEKHGRGIEALEDGVLWCFPGEFVEDLEKRFPVFLGQCSKIVMNDLIDSEENIFFHRFENPQEKYTALRRFAPALFDRVPFSYLANYFGVSEDILRHLHSSKSKIFGSATQRKWS